MTKLLRHRLVLPIAALLALLLVNTISRPHSSSITVRDGQLYGSIIDILRNSAPLMLVALGMTIVIATRGIDLSVGALMAVSGAVALTIIDGSGHPDNPTTLLIAIAAGVLVDAAVRRLERLPGRGARHPTDHRDARADARRARHRAAHHRRLHHDGDQRALPVHVAGLPARPAVRVLRVGRRDRASSRSSSGAPRSACSPRRSASTRGRAGSRACARAASSGVPTPRAVCSRASPASCTARTSWPPTRTRPAQYIELDAILAVVLGGTSLMGGKFSIAGTVIGVFTIQTLKSTITVPRRAASGELRSSWRSSSSSSCSSSRGACATGVATPGRAPNRPDPQASGGGPMTVTKIRRRDRPAGARCIRRVHQPPGLVDPGVRGARHPHRAARRRRRSTSATS